MGMDPRSADAFIAWRFGVVFDHDARRYRQATDYERSIYKGGWPR